MNVPCQGFMLNSNNGKQYFSISRKVRRIKLNLHCFQDRFDLIRNEKNAKYNINID